MALPSNAARAAYALLERTRSTGGCDGALELLLLVSADFVTSPDNLAAEYQHAAAACPNDPTPGWITGQAQLRRLFPSYDARPSIIREYDRADLATAVATLECLAKQFPDDGAAVTGLGDGYLHTTERRNWEESAMPISAAPARSSASANLIARCNWRSGPLTDRHIPARRWRS